LNEGEWACRLHLLQSSRHGCPYNRNPWHPLPARRGIPAVRGLQNFPPLRVTSRWFPFCTSVNGQN